MDTKTSKRFLTPKKTTSGFQTNSPIDLTSLQNSPIDLITPPSKFARTDFPTPTTSKQLFTYNQNEFPPLCAPLRKCTPHFTSVLSTSEDSEGEALQEDDELPTYGDGACAVQALSINSACGVLAYEDANDVENVCKLKLKK